MNTISFTPQQVQLHSYIIKCTKASDNHIGLFYGKLGASIIFYEYGRLEDNSPYTRYAGSLLDQVWTNIHNQTPLSFDTGIYGIGWGLEYLIQNKFVEGSGSETCEEINQKIIQLDPRRMTDFSLETGLQGLLHYLLIHIRGCKQQNVPIAFDYMFLSEVNARTQELSQKYEKTNIIDSYNNLIVNGILEYIPSLTNFGNIGDIPKSKKSIGLVKNKLVNTVLNSK